MVCDVKYCEIAIRLINTAYLRGHAMSTRDLPITEHSFDGDIEDEDTGSAGTPVKPWDPDKIRITTKNFTLREVVEQINEREIDLTPDFQRDFVWKPRQRTRLIESILLGIPLPAFYFNQDRDGTYQVVDGVQRLSTVRSFMSDDHVLAIGDLEYLRDLKDLTYSRLDPAMVRRFRTTQIVVHVIEPQTPIEIKYDIFGRVNTLGAPLSAQEIRHAMSKARSRNFLGELVRLPSFDKATDYSFWRTPPDAPKERMRDSKRMTDRELALRFCAFYHFSPDEYRQYENLDAFLIEFTRRIDGRSDRGNPIDDQTLEDLRQAFDQAMVNARQVLEKMAFRRPSDKRRAPINRAVFESQAIALALYSLEQLLPRADAIRTAFRKAFDDGEYTRAISTGTGSLTTIVLRLGRTREILEGILK
jgi:Protein of unknown function DUF262